MATRFIDKASGTGGILDFGNAAGIQVDTNDSFQLKYNQNGTLATVVDTALAQTLTNKTLTSPIATTPQLGGAAGTATSMGTVIKLKTAIADATATDVYTVTVPNAAHAATIRILVLGSLGAGGAVGAFEVNSGSQYHMNVSRTAGVATVIATSTQLGVASAAVAGATTVTATVAASAVTGANSATQTFTIQVTVTKGAGTSANHQAILVADIINANATGITIA